MEIGDGVVEIFTFISKNDIWRPFVIPEQQHAKSTGIVINKGLILTNYHVVKNNNRLKCRLSGKETLNDLEVLGYMPERDMALCQLVPEKDDPQIKTLEIINHFPWVDQKVFAVGYPLGFGTIRVSEGNISGFQDTITNISWVPESERTFLLEFTCPINPGNSGGALVDSKNRVLGLVNSAIESAHGVGFAIPGPIILNEIDKLYKGRAHPQPWNLQTQVIPKSPGLYIVGILPMNTTEVQVGDILLEVDRKEVRGNMLQKMPLKAYVQSHRVKDLTVKRGSKTLTLPFTPAKKPNIRYCDSQLEGLEYYVILGLCISRLTINHIRDAIKDGDFSYAEYIKPKNWMESKYFIVYVFPNSPVNNLGLDLRGELIDTINGLPAELGLQNLDKRLKIITDNYKLVDMPLESKIDSQIVKEYKLDKTHFPLL